MPETDPTEDTTTRARRSTPRRWWVHVLAIVFCALAGVLGFAGAVATMLSVYPACEANFSEDTIVAPDSRQGRLLCSITSDGEIVDSAAMLYALMGTPRDARTGRADGLDTGETPHCPVAVLGVRNPHPLGVGRRRVGAST